MERPEDAAMASTAAPKKKKDDAVEFRVTVQVEEVKGRPGIWCVEATASGGVVQQAMFVGPEARERAAEYAEMKYGLKARERQRRRSTAKPH